ncbi:potassium voltage-gated channel subfamily H member 8-like [Protopterus annectens]|uniref:potassium voltage-gated channel subfamily H member 8-like n=1 Tax=Protopterus annectens TaxID=7888 RepID=UPI001CFB8DDE|nr:potassium voltage-gated channel subfamily H member 8-like [Protopterus annectens]
MLPSIIEDEEDDEEHGSMQMSHISTRKTVLLQYSNNGNNGSSPGENTKSFHSGPVSAKSPVKVVSSNPSRNRHNNEHHCDNRKRDKNLKLHLTTEDCTDSPNLSPRIVDGIEDGSNNEENQTFDFDSEQIRRECRTSHANTGSEINPILLATKVEETKQQISRLNLEVSSLGQELSQLGKDMRNVTHLLETLLSAQKLPAYCPVHGTAVISAMEDLQNRMTWTTHQPCMHIQAGVPVCTKAQLCQSASIPNIWETDPDHMGNCSQRMGTKVQTENNHHCLAGVCPPPHYQIVPHGGHLQLSRCTSPHRDSTSITPLQSISSTLPPLTCSSSETSFQLLMPGTAEVNGSCSHNTSTSQSLDNLPTSLDIEGAMDISQQTLSSSPTEIVAGTAHFTDEKAINV